jgi:hypothetical protein
MSTRIVVLSRFVAAAGATVITAVSAWAFVNSTATERDPFHFAAVMAANAQAQVRIAQAQSRTVSTCGKRPRAQDHLPPVCLRG